jgi:hypothetical protein
MPKSTVKPSNEPPSAPPLIRKRDSVLSKKGEPNLPELVTLATRFFPTLETLP